MTRLFITTSDLQMITGTGYRNALKIMQRLKDSLGKKNHQHITIKEYCDYEGISIAEVTELLKLDSPKKQLPIPNISSRVCINKDCFWLDKAYNKCVGPICKCKKRQT